MFTNDTVLLQRRRAELAPPLFPSYYTYYIHMGSLTNIDFHQLNCTSHRCHYTSNPIRPLPQSTIAPSYGPFQPKAFSQMSPHRTMACDQVRTCLHRSRRQFKCLEALNSTERWYMLYLLELPMEHLALGMRPLECFIYGLLMICH